MVKNIKTYTLNLKNKYVSPERVGRLVLNEQGGGLMGGCIGYGFTGKKYLPKNGGWINLSYDAVNNRTKKIDENICNIKAFYGKEQVKWAKIYFSEDIVPFYVVTNKIKVSGKNISKTLIDKINSKI